MGSMKLSTGGNMQADIKQSSDTGVRILQRLMAVEIILLSLTLTIAPDVLAAVGSETPDTSRQPVKKLFIQHAVRLQMLFIANEG